MSMENAEKADCRKASDEPLCAMRKMVIKLWKSAVKDKIGIVIALAVFLLSAFTKISPVILVVLAGLTGLVIGFVNRKKEGEAL